VFAAPGVIDHHEPPPVGLETRYVRALTRHLHSITVGVGGRYTPIGEYQRNVPHLEGFINFEAELTACCTDIGPQADC